MSLASCWVTRSPKDLKCPGRSLFSLPSLPKLCRITRDPFAACDSIYTQFCVSRSLSFWPVVLDGDRILGGLVPRCPLFYLPSFFRTYITLSVHEPAYPPNKQTKNAYFSASFVHISPQISPQPCWILFIDRNNVLARINYFRLLLQCQKHTRPSGEDETIAYKIETTNIDLLSKFISIHFDQIIIT